MFPAQSGLKLQRRLIASEIRRNRPRSFGFVAIKLDRSVRRGRVNVVDDDDRKRLFLRDEFEAGLLRGLHEGGAYVVGADGARDLGRDVDAEGDVVSACEAGFVDELPVLEYVHHECEHLRDRGAGKLNDDAIAIAADHCAYKSAR
jgi:hypothetical protein